MALSLYSLYSIFSKLTVELLVKDSVFSIKLDSLLISVLIILVINFSFFSLLFFLSKKFFSIFPTNSFIL